jgi:hypothetical protein
MAEMFTPEQARFSAKAIERVPGIDSRLGAQTIRDGSKLAVIGQLLVI